MKKIVVIILLLTILSIKLPIYADDLDEELDSYEIDNLLEVSSDIEKEPTINSRHAIVYDRTTGEILYGKEENEKCKMASTTKIMTAIIVMENEKNLNKSIKITAKSAGTGGSRLGLHTNDNITIKDLLYGLLLCSRK